MAAAELASQVGHDQTITGVTVALELVDLAGPRDDPEAVTVDLRRRGGLS